MKENRRNFIKKTALVAGVGGSIASSFFTAGAGVSKEGDKDKKVRLGFIGVGLRGQNHLELVLERKDCVVIALADINEPNARTAQDMVVKAGGKSPFIYTKGEYDFLNLLKREDIDAVIIATPWEWHASMAVESMKHGKNVGVEVSAANTLEECWDLVNTSENTGKQCMILENVCYRRDVMAVLNMVRNNIFGELIHLECGYQH